MAVGLAVRAAEWCPTGEWWGVEAERSQLWAHLLRSSRIGSGLTLDLLARKGNADYSAKSSVDASYVHPAYGVTLEHRSLSSNPLLEGNTGLPRYYCCVNFFFEICQYLQWSHLPIGLILLSCSACHVVVRIPVSFVLLVCVHTYNWWALFPFFVFVSISRGVSLH